MNIFPPTWLIFKPSRSDLSTECGPDMANAGPVVWVPIERPVMEAPVPNKTLLLLISFQLEHLTSRCGYTLQDHGFDAHEQAEVREFTVCALECQALILSDEHFIHRCYCHYRHLWSRKSL